MTTHEPMDPAVQVTMLREAIQQAYGYLWHVNIEPGTPNQYAPERAAYEARKLLRDVLTHEQRGTGINMARAAMGRDAPGAEPPKMQQMPCAMCRGIGRHGIPGAHCSWCDGTGKVMSLVAAADTCNCGLKPEDCHPDCPHGTSRSSADGSGVRGTDNTFTIGRHEYQAHQRGNPVTCVASHDASGPGRGSGGVRSGLADGNGSDTTLDSRDGEPARSEGLFPDVSADLPAAKPSDAGDEVRSEGELLVRGVAGDSLDGVAARANALALLPRIDAAIQRIVNGQGCMRIPADLEDPDLVLADCKRLLKHVSGVLASDGGQSNG